MGKGTIGILAGLLAWVGAAASAEAQGFDVSSPTPLAIIEGNSSYTVSATVSGPSEYQHRLLIYRGSQCVWGSTWIAGSGTQAYCQVNGLSRTAGETLKHKWMFMASGWSPTTEIWNVAVTSYYGHGSLKDDGYRLRPAGEGLAWLDRKSLGVQA